VTFTGQFPNKWPLIYLFKVKLNKSEYILELLDISKMKMNWKLLLLMDTVAVYLITVWRDADILKVTVATVLYKHLTTQMLLSQHNILKLYIHLQ
jgi:hypothetical protein